MMTVVAFYLFFPFAVYVRAFDFIRGAVVAYRVFHSVGKTHLKIVTTTPFCIFSAIGKGSIVAVVTG